MSAQRRLTPPEYLLVALTLLLAGTAGADEHWETLADLHSLESRLLGAGSLCIEFEIRSQGVVESELKGTARMIRPDSARIEASGEFAGSGTDILFRTHLDRMYGDNGDQKFEEETPIALTEGLIIGMTRMGLLHNLAMLSSGSPPERIDGSIRQWVKPGNVKKGESKSVDGGNVDSLEFTVVVDGQPAGEAVLWLDSDSGLPVKREQLVHFSQGDMKVVERYTSIAVDCKIRPR
jgi:hypothetical protein